MKMKSSTLLIGSIISAINISSIESFSLGTLQLQRQSTTQQYSYAHTETTTSTIKSQKKIVIIGAGWAGLSAAHSLSKSNNDLHITVVDAAPRVGGLVRDGFPTINGTAVAEAGQHGFWDNYIQAVG
jgi:ribulose 1,5-bisphosphate synthetase/thiazole synthase